MTAAAVLPAAGASSRMGRAKLLLPFRGSTLVGAVTASLRQAGVNPLVLVTAPDDEELRLWAAAAGLLAAVNPQPARGMLSSILAGIAALGGAAALAARGEVLLVTPADLPLLRSATVTLLLDRRAATDAPLAVPVYQGRRGHPLVIASRLIPEIPTLDPAEGLRQLRERHAAAALEVEVDDPGTVFDVDTPEDYARLAEAAGR
jgi:molybdenum cofactor cytidylyltransferase